MVSCNQRTQVLRDMQSAVFEFHFIFQVFDGYKTQGAEISRKFLPQAIEARYIRLRAIQWYHSVAAKLEIYGCEGRNNKLWNNAEIQHGHFNWAVLT